MCFSLTMNLAIRAHGGYLPGFYCLSDPKTYTPTPKPLKTFAQRLARLGNRQGIRAAQLQIVSSHIFLNHPPTSPDPRSLQSLGTSHDPNLYNYTRLLITTPGQEMDMCLELKDARPPQLLYTSGCYDFPVSYLENFLLRCRC